jgi:hypothetical protein
LCDSWDYCSVNEVVHCGPADQQKISLRELVQSCTDQSLSSFIERMSIDSFKLLLLEMPGPVLQTSSPSLRLSLCQFCMYERPYDCRTTNSWLNFFNVNKLIVNYLQENFDNLCSLVELAQQLKNYFVMPTYRPSWPIDVAQLVWFVLSKCQLDWFPY